MRAPKLKNGLLGNLRKKKRQAPKENRKSVAPFEGGQPFAANVNAIRNLASFAQATELVTRTTSSEHLLEDNTYHPALSDKSRKVSSFQVVERSIELQDFVGGKLSLGELSND